MDKRNAAPALSARPIATAFAALVLLALIFLVTVRVIHGRIEIEAGA